MSNVKLEALVNANKDYKHIWYTDSSLDAISKWTELGKPRMWYLVATSGEYTLYDDRGYGLMALFKGDELVNMGKHAIVTNEVVAIQNEYYGTTNRIFIANNNVIEKLD